MVAFLLDIIVCTQLIIHFLSISANPLQGLQGLRNYIYNFISIIHYAVFYTVEL